VWPCRYKLRSANSLVLAFAPGTRLGAHEIVALIGSGGMGEVYRAKDTKLGRDVALKILPMSFTNDPERIARFRREAQVLASLNHSHIAQIYGLEEANGSQFLVLELVDGESLDKRIARGPVPLDEALAIAEQTAEALVAAHEKGIIHRDLKPANIALTQDGVVKVLDFGLAKAVDATSGLPFDAMNSPTITSPALMTGIGTLLGTAAYMSPEQARGKAADKRSDIWAFGCVLYETLTGKRAFEGEDVSDTLANVLKAEPDWTPLTANVPPPLCTFLARCFRKNPAERMAGLSAFLFLASEPTVLRPTAALAPVQAVGRRRITAGFSLAVIALGVIAGAIGWTLRPMPAARVVRLQLTLPEPEAAMNFNFPAMAISPDGTEIVYAANNRLFRRVLSELTSHPIDGTEDESPSTPVFSPDGRFLVFRSTRGARGALKRVPVTGGGSVTLATDVARGATWDAHGIFFVQYGKGVAHVSPDGGTPEVVIPLHRSKSITLDALDRRPKDPCVRFGRVRHADQCRVLAGWPLGGVYIDCAPDPGREYLRPAVSAHRGEVRNSAGARRQPSRSPLVAGRQRALLCPSGRRIQRRPRSDAPGGRVWQPDADRSRVRHRAEHGSPNF